MKVGNFAFELADLRAEQERAAGVARAQAAIRGMGSIICVDCEEPIEPARRAALPSAERCIGCAILFERQRRRVA